MFHTDLLKLALLLGIILSAVCDFNAQVINPQIKGLSIGSKHKDIVINLGRPISDKLGGNVPCGGDTMRTLFYRGLVLRLEAGGTRALGLYKVEVSSPKWSVSGLRIGARRIDVVKIFGPGPYFISDGYARFQFKRNRLVKMEWEFNFC